MQGSLSVSVSNVNTYSVLTSFDVNHHLLALEPTPAIKEVYNHPFNLTFVVTLSEHQLSTDLHVKNVALSTSAPLEFQALFHNYIRAPANEITITPLHNVTYYDKTEATDELRAQTKIETRTAVDVKKFTDSVYENAPGRYLITSLFGKIEVKTQNFPNVVVWNPQAEAGAKIGDMEEGGWYARMHRYLLTMINTFLGRNMFVSSQAMCEDLYLSLPVKLGLASKLSR